MQLRTFLLMFRVTDPQGQGREAARDQAQGGDGRQACEDQGRPREEAGAHPDEAQPDARRRGAHAGAAAAAVSLCESMSFLNVVDDAAAAGYVEQGNKTTNTRCVSRAAKDEHDERGCGSLEGWQWLLATHMHARGPTAWESFVGARAFGAFYAAAHVVHWLRYAWLERDYLTFSYDVCRPVRGLFNRSLRENPSMVFTLPWTPAVCGLCHCHPQCLPTTLEHPMTRHVHV